MHELSEAQLQFKTKLEDLIRAASRADINVAGFAFATNPPLIINFGNVGDADDIRIYEKLIEMSNEQRDKGNVINNPVGEVH